MTDHSNIANHLILVTGATGFVGRHLCTTLVAQGYKVRGTYRSLEPPLDFPVSIEWISVPDIGPDTDWSLALAQVGYIIHLAGLAHQMGMQSKDRKDEFARINSQGTQRLVECVSKSQSALRLVFISSIGAVKSLSDEIINNSTPCMPDTAYGKSKLLAELAIQKILKDTTIDWCILRPPMIYGPRNPGNMARLLKLINFGIPLPFANIKNKRSFIFIGNLISAIQECLVCDKTSRQIFVISDGTDLATPELVQKLANYSNKNIHLIPVPNAALTGLGQIGDFFESITGSAIGIDSYSVQRLLGSLPIDSSTFMQEFNWIPPYTIDEGLSLTLLKITGT